MAYKTTVATLPFGQTYYNNLLNDRALPEIVYGQFGDEKPLPKNNGKIIDFRRFESFAAATVALTEGTTPNPSDYTVNHVSATVDQYGRTAGITDMVDFTKPDDHLTELTEMLGENKGNTYDIIIRNAVVPNTTSLYGGAAAGIITLGAATVAGIVLDAVMVDKAVRVLRNADAQFWTRAIRSGPGENSFPIEPAYFAVTHPNISYTVRNFTDFRPVAAYAKPSEMMQGEYGAYKNVRFCESTNGYTAAAGVDYYTAFFAKHAFAKVPLSGMDGKLYFHGFGSGDDVLEQRATVGWKGAWTAAILNDAFMVVVRTRAEA